MRWWSVRWKVEEGYTMFETIRRLYQAGKLTAAGVEAAAVKGWITQEQAQEIVEGSYGR